MTMLNVDNVSRRFGGLQATRNVCFQVNRGEIVSLIGPNGAGKTTMFNMITGFVTPNEGEITFDGVSVGHLKPHKIAQLGIVRSFQITNVFSGLTVRENLVTAHYLRARGSFLETMFNTSSARARDRDVQENVDSILTLVGLQELAEEEARNLAYGKLRLLEIAIGLSAAPRLLLLDEPAAGLNTEESVRLVALLRHICRELDITILLVEHDMNVVMEVSDRVVVLNFGEKIAEGTPADIRSNAAVIEAYLGGSLEVSGEAAHA
ncbi:ABC transporter ATP-binding protein [Ferrovibrio xuzhouensis]|uniref:ABC transporter ATP-binding protein n=1 Tax=Ferrovibrio xuzhouensis TaxID=1576914 RepID=A0ABV7VKH9_9PROT